MTLQDKVISTVRTMVAAAAGWVIAWLAVKGFRLDAQTSLLVQGAAVTLATGLYHAAVSWVQRRWPRVVRRWPHLGRALAVFVALALGSMRQPVAYAPPRPPTSPVGSPQQAPK
jgi:cobalamin biosynthesis protein CobD/CbiB